MVPSITTAYAELVRMVPHLQAARISRGAAILHRLPTATLRSPTYATARRLWSGSLRSRMAMLTEPATQPLESEATNVVHSPSAR